MSRDWKAVLAGERKWACVASDAVAFLGDLPNDSIDMMLTSPPYEAARNTGDGVTVLEGDEWVKWMVGFVRAASPKVTGLIAIVCEGETEDFSYSATPFLLMADLKRAGFTLRKPPVYRRSGVFGSGGPDWLKNNWEPVVCVTRGGRLPWSDPTACGHPPKYAPGGNPSHRKKDGTRVKGKPYKPPALANPGNVIDIGAAGGRHLGNDLAHENEAPFALELADFFMKSFCKPGGVACDPFCGSGTVSESAVSKGRRFVGCDVRESQVLLCGRRMARVVPKLPLEG